jgi:chitodextrinase
VWSAPSTDNLRRQLATLALLVPLVLVAGTDAATARSWSSVDELAARSGFARIDLTPPSTTTGLTLTKVTATSLSLSWQPSHDDRKLSGYALYRDGIFVVARSRTAATFHGLACGRTYRLGVAAFDAAGNESEVASLSASTSPCPDTLAPTQPANLTQTGATGSTISLFWSPSLDDVSVAGYGLYRDGVRIGTATGTSFVVEGLACGTSYMLGIDSYDSAGNRSAITSVFASTSPCLFTTTPTASPPSPPPPPPATPPAPTPPPAPLPSTTAELGVYRGSGRPDLVAEFGTWLGRQPTIAVDFLPWENVPDPTWWAQQWKGTGYKVSYSVPMLPTSGGSFAACTSGSYDAKWRGLATVLVREGAATSILRIGWELNGEWMSWYAGGDPAGYAACFRRVVNTVRSVAGQQFKFDWNQTRGRTLIPAAYPGDAYVDYIGTDPYDYPPANGTAQQRWTLLLADLNGVRDFALQHGKSISFPEWGLWGQENTLYIDNLAAWFRQNNVAYHAYFDYDAVALHRLSHFPQASARFAALFGPLP